MLWPAESLAPVGAKWLGILLFISVAWLAARGGREIHLPLLQRCRVLLPAWRFFAEPTPLIVLRARCLTRDGQWSPWQQVLSPEIWKPWHLFFAPETCHRLALESKIAAFAVELQAVAEHSTTADIQRHQAYAFIDKVVETWANSQHASPVAFEFVLDYRILEPTQVTTLPFLHAPVRPLATSDHHGSLPS